MTLADWEVEDLRAGERLRAQYERRLRAHPNCRDPDHPGCDFCEPEPTQENDDE